MPTGIYQRKKGLKRNYTPEQRAAMRERLLKARQLSDKSPTAKAARKENAARAQGIRNARALLKHMPAGAVSGTVFKCSSCRSYRVIDATPQQRGSVWEQRFEQSGAVVVYGIRKEFSGIVKIVWEYQPTIENIMDAPRLIEDTGSGGE